MFSKFATLLKKQGDGKLFCDTTKGETAELKCDLHSDRLESKLVAVKRIIAGMTLGQDMSMLFPDVLSCAETDNLELKKMIYLYLTANAHRKPDEAVMAINTLAKDCIHHTPIIRALAVRTLGSIRVDNIVEHLADSLKNCLLDENAYVRKTAVICVAKMHRFKPELVHDLNFVIKLKTMMTDANPAVFSNVVAALLEVDPDYFLTIEARTAGKMLAGLRECNEWGKTVILEALMYYQPTTNWELTSLVEQVRVYLIHANAAIVLTALRLLLAIMTRLSDESELKQNLTAKISSSLITLLSAGPELQYVVLRNILIIIRKHPKILQNDVRAFFVKYNDEIYVKMEKLEILVQLGNAENVQIVLSELRQYATEVDVEFVEKVVQAIGRLAIKLPTAAKHCVITLLILVETKIDYIVQKAIVVFRDIFRRYPNCFEAVTEKIFESMDNLNDPEARAALIWMLGEYAERIDDAQQLLQQFVENFKEESVLVQYATLTATVRMFIKKTADTSALAQEVLQKAVELDSPDLRDRAYIYWRLLSTDPEAARQIVLAQKPPIEYEPSALSDHLIAELLPLVGTVASVLHKPKHDIEDKKQIRLTNC